MRASKAVCMWQYVACYQREAICGKLSNQGGGGGGGGCGAAGDIGSGEHKRDRQKEVAFQCTADVTADAKTSFNFRPVRAARKAACGSARGRKFLQLFVTLGTFLVFDALFCHVVRNLLLYAQFGEFLRNAVCIAMSHGIPVESASCTE